MTVRLPYMGRRRQFYDRPADVLGLLQAAYRTAQSSDTKPVCSVADLGHNENLLIRQVESLGVPLLTWRDQVWLAFTDAHPIVYYRKGKRQEGFARARVPKGWLVATNNMTTFRLKFVRDLEVVTPGSGLDLSGFRLNKGKGAKSY